MKQSLGAVWKFILGWIFVTILLTFFVQARDFYGNTPIIRRRQGVIEAFQLEAKVQESDDPTLEKQNPGDPALSKPTQPYSLLNDWLATADKPVYPSAQRCHEADFQKRLERTGNFRQLTNNYKRGDPDSCSGLTQDLTLAFYKNDPVEQMGCIQPFA